MKVTVFTSNQPRHLALIKELSLIADEVFAVLEVNTIFPGKTKGFYNKSEVMKQYFEKVLYSEKRFFGEVSSLPSNVKSISIAMGDLNHLEIYSISQFLESDHYIVFGSSYIKAPLIDFLVEKNALNIHMGISPYYRGSNCNFWAAFDKNYHLIGATIHQLTKGLDSGDILFHALPNFQNNYFDFGMSAVKAAIKGYKNYLLGQSKINYHLIKQYKTKEIRYSTYADFTDEQAQLILEQRIELEQHSVKVKENLINPFKLTEGE